ncbi:DUF58 domain-containing protein [Bermanella marisrubri]|uniref:Uncharacterized protein n=1 Tax=Bermanella marisrubri TaxID=207949 RepID=Q1N6Q3_9GAMM|nr:DUF58 domain-containing protein [Bermanella marisrubri]EAT13539.1 hypothetical protein RED65_09114 [Oceanobacter sp. RED65] [Bermanella marisrubri]QIZ84336.1 DUF58 domain-containing protein [Bermanella marisrubri]
MMLLDPIRKRLSAVLGAWLKRRLPRTSSVQLTQKRIFIFPSRVGWGFVVMLVLVFVTGVNYQNNLLLSLCFLLVSLMITAMIETYRNLAKLHIQSGKVEDCYAGDIIQLPIRLSTAKGKTKHALFIGFSAEHSQLIGDVKEQKRLGLQYVVAKRGVLEPERFTIFSRYPLGLFHCWTWVFMAFDGVAFPQPILVPFQKYTGAGDGEGDKNLLNQGDVDDALDFRIYQKGDSLKHIAWKQFAKTGQLYSKVFREAMGEHRDIDWRAAPSQDWESRLSIMCAWVLESHENQMPFSLRLPNIYISKNFGEAHLKECLHALAHFKVVT